MFDTKDDTRVKFGNRSYSYYKGNKRFSSDINHDSYVSLLGLNWIYDKTLHKDNFILVQEHIIVRMI